MKKILIPIIVSALALIFIFAYQTGSPSGKELTIVFCDVGQGDAIYIRTPENIDILVDGGRDSKVLKCLSDNMPFGDQDIELMFATHPDADHITGLINVIESYTVKSFDTSTLNNINDTVTFNKLIDLVKSKQIPLRLISTGDKFTLSDGVAIETLWPKANFESKDTNEYSLVQKVKFGNFALLLTGDITYQILDNLNLGTNSIDVFKLPHHGSKTGVDNSTFEKIRTGLAIISAGKNNPYHHPHPSVIFLLKKFGIKYERTDKEGSIKIVTDGKTTKVIK